MPIISDITTAAPASTSDLIGNVGANTRRFTAQQVLATGRWGVSAQFVGATAGGHLAFRVPFNCFIDEWDMNASTGATTAAASATVEVRVNGISSTPATSAAQISSGALPTLSNAVSAGSSAISSWSSTTLTEDTWITLFLATVSSANNIRFSLGGRRS